MGADTLGVLPAGCDVTRPLPPAPLTVKTKQTPPTEARNAHSPKLDGDIFFSERLPTKVLLTHLIYMYTHI